MKTIKLMLGIALFSGTAFATENETSFFSRFVDENAKLNIEQVYLPDMEEAIKVSKSKTLTYQQKQNSLYGVLKRAREFLQNQRGDVMYHLVSPGIHYKLEQFNHAIAVGDFNETAKMAISAKAIALKLID